MSRSSKTAQRKRLDQLRILLARKNPNAFIQLVLRDEETGVPVTQAPTHKRIQAAINEHKYLVCMAHVESGKTQQAIGRALFELGKNPNLRVCIASATKDVAENLAATISRYIAEPDLSGGMLHRVFPNLKPEPGGKWSADKGYYIERKGNPKDPSIRSVGLHGSILSARIDFLVIDDLITGETTATEYRRKDVLDWYAGTLRGRLTKDARVVFLCNAWHEDDAAAVLSKRPGWSQIVIPVEEADGTLNWEDRWPKDRIESWRMEDPLEASRLLDCVRRKVGQNRFREEYIELCKKRGMPLLNRLTKDNLPTGAKVYTGVDLAFSKSRGRHQSCMFTILVFPDGRKRILNIRAGQWTANEFYRELSDLNRDFPTTEILVEDNVAQKWIQQLATGQFSNVRGFSTTGQKKKNENFGVESIANELAAGLWEIPCNNSMQPWPLVAEWINDMRTYDPSGHTGDLLMASWFAREASRKKGFTHRIATISSMPVGNSDLLSKKSKWNANEAERVSAMQMWEELGIN